MRYGICILPEYTWSEAKPLWQEAQERGFDHAWTYDHLVWGGLPDSPWHSTVATLSAAAMVTDSIKLGTFVASPNFRHPLTFARDIITLDDISGGRMLIGLGAGGDRDSQILGATHTRGERTRRFAEFTELLDRILTTDHVDFAGEFFSTVDARNAPGCVQQPRVPFVMAANGPKAMALAARYGTGWLTTGPPMVGLGESLDLGDRSTQETWWQGVVALSERFGETLDKAVEQGSRTSADVPDRLLALDAAGIPALSSPDFFAEQVGRAADLGFTDVIVHWPRNSSPYRADPDVLDRITLQR